MKRKPKRLPLTRQQRDDLKFELRKAFLLRGAKQINANRFELSELTSSGMYRTFDFILMKFGVRKRVLDTNWKRKSKKTGNAKPYKWVVWAEAWLDEVSVVFEGRKRERIKILGLSRTT